MIPQTAKEWKNCIENQCKIPLTESFIKSRLTIYENNEHPETKTFARLYGEKHLNNIISWLKQQL
jgi:hypothetical protein